MTGMHGETEKEQREGGGRERGLVVRMGGGWRGLAGRFEPYQGFTAGHNSMCGDCVEGLASRARALPPGTVVCGGRGFRFQCFSPPSCGLLDVFVLGAKVNLKRNKEGGKHLPSHCSCVTSPFTTALPSFFVLCSSGSSQCHARTREEKNGNAEEFTSSLILAMGSWPENTSSNFCLYWSSCVFSSAASLTSAPGLLQDYSALWVSSGRPPPALIFLFSLHSRREDFLRVPIQDYRRIAAKAPLQV